MNTDEARDYLVELYQPEFAFYIKNTLPGDLAVQIAEDHKQMSAVLVAERELNYGC